MKQPNFGNTSESFKRLNPHLFGAGELLPAEPQQAPGPALASKPPRQRPGTRRVEVGGPRFRVSLVAYRRRLLDADNLGGGFKHLRDAIAKWLGYDDAEHFIVWEYGQLQTNGQQQCAVRIERLR